MSPPLGYGRVILKPLTELEQSAWRRVYEHFRDPEIAHLNGTPPSRMPLWLLKRILKADSRRSDRATFGIFDVSGDVSPDEVYIGTIELYDIKRTEATLGIIIGERSHWSKGFGPEAVRALLKYAFEELCLERVTLSTFEDNPRAQSAFKKVGFAERRRVPAGKGRTDVQMELRRGTWLAEQRSTLDVDAEGVSKGVDSEAETSR